jgi:two-component system cell cycle response regulator
MQTDASVQVRDALRSNFSGQTPTALPAALREQRPLNVIVADRDERARRLLAAAVRCLGHACRVASDGLEAWRLYQDDPAHVILSDWNLPGMDGIDLCRRVREASRGGHTHFILVTSLDKQESVVEGMGVGVDDFLIKPVDLGELDARLRAAWRVVAINQAPVERHQTLERDSDRFLISAHTDPLTQATNRLRLQGELEALGDRSLRYGHRYCAALCDIDSFKSYSDAFGRLAGDDAIQLVSRAVQDQLRRGDGFYPCGGEEFLVLLPEQSLSGARECMERVRKAVSSRSDAAHGLSAERSVTISVGIAEFRVTTDADAIRSWLQRADSALRRAKGRGRNRVETEE